VQLVTGQRTEVRWRIDAVEERHGSWKSKRCARR
jgi:hypothetical protein